MQDYNIYLQTEIVGPVKTTSKYGYVIELTERENVINTLTEIGCMKDATCYRLLVAAVCRALDKIQKKSRVTIYTDSMYLQNAFAEDWIGQWATAGWKNKKKQPVKNDDIWKLVAEKADKHEISIIRQQRHQYSSWLMDQMQKEDIPPGKSRIIRPT